MNMMCKSDGTRNKICPVSLGLAIGVAKGLSLMIFAWAGYFWHFGLPMTHQIAEIYHGFAPSIEGGLWGGLWGFIGGFIFGIIVGFVYNCCICCCCCLRSACKKK